MKMMITKTYQKDCLYNSPVIFNSGQKATSTVYSDRLYRWDYKKHDELCKKHFGNEGQHWSNRGSEQIEAFLRDYVGDQSLVLCRIEEHENKATGYPVWRFDYICHQPTQPSDKK